MSPAGRPAGPAGRSAAAPGPAGQPWISTSKKGWVRAEPDFRYWIPCPGEFPEGMTRASWSQEAAELHWEAAALPRSETAIQALAAMLSLLHEESYRDLLCHQIWIYLREAVQLPLPVYVGIWEQRGETREQLMALSGASDPETVRAPAVVEFNTTSLGDGIRSVRHKKLRDGSLCGVLGYAFRSAEFETDVQVWTSTPDLPRLVNATRDINDLVRSMSVFSQAELRR